MGQRHLHYCRGEDFFAFASEVRGLSVLADTTRTFDNSVLARSLAFDRAPPRGTTLFKGVFGIEGGTLIKIDQHGRFETRRYWTPHPDVRHANRNEAYYIRAYREVLGEAVACRIRRARHVPALMLAGGFDSGAIAGLAGPVLGGKEKSLVCVASVDAENGPARGVRKWAQTLARHMRHLDVRYVTREGLDVYTNMEARFVQTGEPHSPNRYASDALCAAAAGAGARIIMDGHGGDYTLNPRGTGWLARRLMRGDLTSFVSELGAHRRHTGTTLARTLRQELVFPLLPAPLAQSWRRLRAGLSVLSPVSPITRAFLKTAQEDNGVDFHVPSRGSDPVSAMTRVLRRQQSSSAIGGALLAASHGLEFSQPFHDKRVVELALAIPESLHVKHGKDRYLARAALADLYPAEFQERGSANDDLVPDFPAMVERIKPRLFGEIARLEKNPKLSGMFDFRRMRRMLGPAKTITKKNETAARNAVRALLYARFLEWFQRDNRLPDP
jgi:asparagine synthase (glutamine-hydrolysing)